MSRAAEHRRFAGYNVIHEEAQGAGLGDGTLAKMHIGRGFGEVPGNNPATGAYRYYLNDNLGSPRGLYDQNKLKIGRYEYDSFGGIYSGDSPTDMTKGFTGHTKDAVSSMYFALHRFYDPTLARWTVNDPLRMVDGPNIYAYVGNRPISSFDELGLKCGGGGCSDSCLKMKPDGPIKCEVLKLQTEVLTCRTKTKEEIKKMICDEIIAGAEPGKWRDASTCGNTKESKGCVCSNWTTEERITEVTFPIDQTRKGCHVMADVKVTGAGARQTGSCGAG